MVLTIYAIFNVLSALLFIGISIPLIRRKVKLNHLYGFRFAIAFKSERNWYDINSAAGKILVYWSLPILAFAVAGFFWPEHLTKLYIALSLGVSVACVLIACLQSYVAARRIDRENAIG